MGRVKKPRIYQGIEGVCRHRGRLVKLIPEVPKGGPGHLCTCGGPLDDRPTWERVTPPSAIDIPYPRGREHDREFVIQAHLLVELRRLGWDAHAEVRVPGRRDRFDIVVYVNERAVRIIEVKPSEAAGVTRTASEFVSWHWRERTEAEITRYRVYGLPVDLVQGMERAREYVAWAQQRQSPE